MTRTDQPWYQWHTQYDDLRSAETDRLEVVQRFLSRAFDEAPPGPLKAVSVCSGQARDLLPVLIHHARGADVAARMVELDPLNAAFLFGALGSTRLVDVDVVVADAGITDAYIGAVPADLVLLGGVFANIGPADASRTVDTLATLCRPGGTVVWTSYGELLADADEVVALFETSSFERIDHCWGERRDYLVAAYRYTGPQRGLPAQRRFFHFS